jgi:hypothetical protein
LTYHVITLWRYKLIIIILWNVNTSPDLSKFYKLPN